MVFKLEEFLNKKILVFLKVEYNFMSEKIIEKMLVVYLNN